MRKQPWPALVKLLRSAFFYYCEITDTLKNKQPGLAQSALAPLPANIEGATARGKFKSKQTAELNQTFVVCKSFYDDTPYL